MENKEFENQLKARRKQFGESLEAYSQEVESYSQKSDMVRRDQVAAEVTELNEKLKAAQLEAEYINAQEKMLGWAATKYNHVSKVWDQILTVPSKFLNHLTFMICIICALCVLSGPTRSKLIHAFLLIMFKKLR